MGKILVGWLGGWSGAIEPTSRWGSLIKLPGKVFGIPRMMLIFFLSKGQKVKGHGVKNRFFSKNLCPPSVFELDL